MTTRASLQALLLSSTLILSACNQYSDGLVGDYEDTSKCPANGCANQAAAATDIRISSSGSAVSLYPKSTDTKVEIGGDCHASTYPSNAITISVVTQSSNTPVTANAYAVAGSSTTPACRRGKWGAVVDIRNLGGGAIYTLKATMTAYDATGAAYTNAGGGSLTLSLVR